jgi:long-chain fatty acid transport protein
LSIGATVGSVFNRNTLQSPYIFQSQPVLAGLKTMLDLHSEGTGWNTSVGVIGQPTDKLQVGASWKSRTVVHSTGTATGDVGAQFAALGVNAPSAFSYSSAVKCIFPQAVLGDISWRVDPRWLLAFQMDWTNWSDSFVNLPVTLTHGTNATINSLVGSDELLDTVPLRWKDQYGFHAGVERHMSENTALRFGFAHANDPVPASTLTPLTAAIMTNQISTGFAYQPGRSKWEVSYAFRPTQSDSVGMSSLLSGEYNNSTVKVGTQSLIVSYSFKF